MDPICKSRKQTVIHIVASLGKNAYLKTALPSGNRVKTHLSSLNRLFVSQPASVQGERKNKANPQNHTSSVPETKSMIPASINTRREHLSRALPYRVVRPCNPVSTTSQRRVSPPPTLRNARSLGITAASDASFLQIPRTVSHNPRSPRSRTSSTNSRTGAVELLYRPCHPLWASPGLAHHDEPSCFSLRMSPCDSAKSIPDMPPKSMLFPWHPPDAHSPSLAGPCRPRLGANHLPRIKLNKHGRVSLEVLHRDGETEIVEEEKLEFEVVQFGKRKPSDLFTPESATGQNKLKGGRRIPWHNENSYKTRRRRTCSHTSHPQ